jgi:large repetitive protein
VNGMTDDQGHPLPNPTNDPLPHMSGTGTPGDTITMYDGKTQIGSTIVGPDGNWVVKPTTDLSSGTHDIYVVETSPAGVPSSESDHTSVIINTSVPATPATPTLTDDNNTAIPAGGTTNDGHPHINGKGVAGDIITVYDGQTVIGSTKVDGSGDWKFTPTTDLAKGAHSISVTETNAAGTPSAHSGSIAFTFSAVVAPPSITSVVDAVGSITGPIANGGVTDDPHPTVSGTGIPGYTVYVWQNGIGCANTIVDATGLWSIKIPGAQTNGVHAITATQFLNSSNVSASSNTWSITVDTHVPVKPVVNGMTDDQGHALSNPTNDPHPTMNGTGTPGDTITMYDGKTQIGSTIVGPDGNWVVKPTADLSSGAHDIYVVETSPAGVQSSESDHFAFTYATVLPPTETVTITSAVDHTSGTPVGLSNGNTTHDTAPGLIGTLSSELQPGEYVQVFRDGQALGSATVSGTGWTFLDSGLAVGPHAYTAQVVSAGGQGAMSSAFNLTEADAVTTFSRMAVTIASVTDGVTAYNYYLDLSANPPPEGSVMRGNGPAVQPMAGTNYVYCITFNSNQSPVNGFSWYASDASGGKALVLYDSHSFGQLISIATSPSQMVWHDLSDNFRAGVQSSRHDTPIQDLALAAPGNDSDSPTPQHVAVGEHDAFVGHAANGNETVDLNADPSSYFKESTAHIEGAKGGAIDTLHLMGDHEILDLTSLTGKTSAAKISGIEVIDLGGQHNTLKLSLTDVLNLGETDLFQQDGKQQMMVQGKEGDVVDLSNSHIAGLAEGEWEQHGTTQVGGVTYNVYEHSGAHTELLVQQGVQIAVH